MPLLNYQCSSCKKGVSKFYKTSKDAPSALACECGGESKRKLSAPGSASVVTIDNGVMSRAVDVNLEVIASNLENSTKDFREKD